MYVCVYVCVLCECVVFVRLCVCVCACVSDLNTKYHVMLQGTEDNGS